MCLVTHSKLLRDHTALRPQDFTMEPLVSTFVQIHRSCTGRSHLEHRGEEWMLLLPLLRVLTDVSPEVPP